MFKLTFKECLIVSVTALVLITAHQLWLTPENPEIAELNCQISELKADIRSVESQEPDLDNLKREISKERKAARALEDKFNAGDTRILTKNDLEELLNTQNSKASLTSEQNLDDFRIVKYAIGFRGSYRDFLKYLASLEASSTYLSVEEFKASKTRVGIDVPLEIEVLIHAIVQNQKSFYGRKEEFEIKNSLFEGRDLFTLVRRNPKMTDKKAGLELSSLVFELKNRYAVINGSAYQEGDTVGQNLIVKEISNRQVRLADGNQNLTLKI